MLQKSSTRYHSAHALRTIATEHNECALFKTSTDILDIDGDTRVKESELPL